MHELGKVWRRGREMNAQERTLEMRSGNWTVTSKRHITNWD